MGFRGSSGGASGGDRQGRWRSFGRVKPLEFGQLFFDEIWVVPAFVPCPNEAIEKQGLREGRHLFRRPTLTKGQQLYLQSI